MGRDTPLPPPEAMKDIMDEIRQRLSARAVIVVLDVDQGYIAAIGGEVCPHSLGAMLNVADGTVQDLLAACEEPRPHLHS